MDGKQRLKDGLLASICLALCLLLAPVALASDAPVPLPPSPERPGAASGATKISVAAWFADISATIKTGLPEPIRLPSMVI